jgi:hypothetical protein
MQQTLTGCAFCDASPGTGAGEAHTWGKHEQVSYSICLDCATQLQVDPDDPGYHACDGCGLVVDAVAALTAFRVTIAHLEGTVRFCTRCSPDGPATYWTRDTLEYRASPSD